MNVGKTILEIRKKEKMSQEEFGKLFYVTRQTVSNWENEKSYPDLQTLINLSDRFDISLDKILKGDKEMVNEITKTVKDGLKWRILRKIAIAATGFIVLAGTIYTISWVNQKEKIEAYFAQGVQDYGFELVDAGYYVQNSGGRISYKLSNQKMPSIMDFRLDFHAKFLDATLEGENAEIQLRWTDQDKIWFKIKSGGTDLRVYLIDEEGNFLKREGNQFELLEVEQEVVKLYMNYQSDIQSVLTKGTEIYKQVYLK